MVLKVHFGNIWLCLLNGKSRREPPCYPGKKTGTISHCSIPSFFFRTFIEWWDSEGGPGINALPFLNKELLKVLLIDCRHEPLRQKKNPFSGNNSLHLHHNTEIFTLPLLLNTHIIVCHKPGNPQFSGLQLYLSEYSPNKNINHSGISHLG